MWPGISDSIVFSGVAKLVYHKTKELVSLCVVNAVKNACLFVRILYVNLAYVPLLGDNKFVYTACGEVH